MVFFVLNLVAGVINKDYSMNIFLLQTVMKKWNLYLKNVK
jgi:hypothetical protein